MLAIAPGGLYVDATFGRGGHAREILTRLGSDGKLLALDRDPQAVTTARAMAVGDPRLLVAHRPFAELIEVVNSLGWGGRVNGVLFDLGVSSPQLDDPLRGFSFRNDGPLDMRMDNSSGLSVSEWLATASAEQIADVLWQYGEERYSRRIARAIVEFRQSHPLDRTAVLAEVIAGAVPTRERHKDPATRSFQALRIYVNDELEQLQAGLMGALAVLAPGGRLVAISFHSLEDRIVKRFMREQARGLQLPPGIPVTGRGSTGSALLRIGKAYKAQPQEVASNPRARSAIMRVAERLKT